MSYQPLHYTAGMCHNPDWDDLDERPDYDSDEAYDAFVQNEIENEE